MSVTLIRKFWNGSQYDDISKIVFTSTNIDSPAAAGTRSHVLPGSPYVGTWYEALDLQYRQKVNQNPPDKHECLFTQIHLYQNSFNFINGTTVTGIAKYPVTTSGMVYYDASNNATISTISYLGDTTISGIEFKKYNITFSATNGDATVSGSHYYFNTPAPPISGSNTLPGAMYIWQENQTNDLLWAHPKNSIIFEVEQGEAYNCRLTAWDDVTHSTINNRLLQDRKYKVTCCAYMAGGGTKENPVPDQSTDAMAHPPGIDVPLAGDDAYYGDFDLIHIANGGTTGQQHGEFFYFVPRLDDVDDTYASGNYDFVTTLHYQYT
jgi:hypothetical protein